MSEWIVWNGGDCPVDDDCIVDIKTANGSKFSKQIAGEWVWSESDNDIMAYRLSFNYD